MKKKRATKQITLTWEREDLDSGPGSAPGTLCDDAKDCYPLGLIATSGNERLDFMRDPQAMGRVCQSRRHPGRQHRSAALFSHLSQGF